MNQLTNEEVARVFAIYQHADILYNSEIEKKPVLTDESFVSVLHKLLSKECVSNYYLLFLVPLNNITDEHAVEVIALLGGKDGNISEVLEMKKEYPDIIKKLIEPFYNMSFRVAENDIHPFTFYSCFQHLILWRYAVPLYFGKDHWANGNTAIELGIAIESI